MVGTMQGEIKPMEYESESEEEEEDDEVSMADSAAEQRYTKLIHVQSTLVIVDTLGT